MIRFKTFRYSLGILIISAALCGFWQRANAQVVEIPDPNLERAIREDLGLSSGVPITQQEMLQLTGLADRHAEIEDLTGLEYAIRVRELFLERNQIRDITPLRGLTNLEVLYLTGNPISDLSPLSELTSLRRLDVAEIPIEDLSILSNLTQLEGLGLRLCEITDITPLANLTKLIFLDLTENQIVDIGPLANLTALKELRIHKNLIVDFSPIQGISFNVLRYDQECVLPDPPIQDRIEKQTFPSVMTGWHHFVLNLPELSYEELVSYHDLFWGHEPFGLRFDLQPPWDRLVGDVDRAIAKRNELLAKNPSMLFLADIRLRNAHLDVHYPEHWFGWLRDADGNLLRDKPRSPTSNGYAIDLRMEEVQDLIVARAISVSRCGLYDGIMFDGWGDEGRSIIGVDQNGTRLVYDSISASESLSMLERIREGVPEDFLILVNSNWDKLPLSIPHINGGLLESRPESDSGYTRGTLAEIEDSLIWFEENAREPKINCLLGRGTPTEPPNGPTSRRWMRFFTTMSLTLSDGYTLYATGRPPQGHFWYPFWDTDLGQPVGPTAQRYQEDIESLYIREFTNGWAVYNRSGQAQSITLPSSATSVSDRGSTAASLTHLLPDLDGEIYIATRSFADVNDDGAVNVLDLVQVANGLGQSTPDPNGDGQVNILDLVFVANSFNQ